MVRSPTALLFANAAFGRKRGAAAGVPGLSLSPLKFEDVHDGRLALSLSACVCVCRGRKVANGAACGVRKCDGTKSSSLGLEVVAIRRLVLLQGDLLNRMLQTAHAVRSGRSWRRGRELCHRCGARNQRLLPSRLVQACSATDRSCLHLHYSDCLACQPCLGRSHSGTRQWKRCAKNVGTGTQPEPA